VFADKAVSELVHDQLGVKLKVPHLNSQKQYSKNKFHFKKTTSSTQIYPNSF
jgi:hypothetical protein